MIRLLIVIFLITTISCDSRKESQNVPKSKEIIRVMSRTYNPKFMTQIEIDITNRALKYRKGLDKEFKLIDDFSKAIYFVDSVNYRRMIEIVDAYASRDKDNLCDFHNEKGYVVVNLIKRGFEYDDILSTSFIINQPYRCKLDEDDILIKTFYNRFTDLINSID